GAVDEREIDVDERDEVLPVGDQLARVGNALRACPYESEVERVARRLESGPAEHVSRHDHCAEYRTGRTGDELPPRNFTSFHTVTCCLLYRRDRTDGAYGPALAGAPFLFSCEHPGEVAVAGRNVNQAVLRCVVFDDIVLEARLAGL